MIWRQLLSLYPRSIPAHRGLAKCARTKWESGQTALHRAESGLVLAHYDKFPGFPLHLVFFLLSFLKWKHSKEMIKSGLLDANHWTNGFHTQRANNLEGASMVVSPSWLSELPILKKKTFCKPPCNTNPTTPSQVQIARSLGQHNCIIRVCYSKDYENKQ